jgi:hypothetical protein
MSAKLKLWIMNTRPYAWLLKHVIPYIRFSTYYTSMRGIKYHQVYDAIEAGDIILTTDSKKLTTWLIGGDFSHAAVCVSKDKVWEVSEMTHSDYTKSTVADLCFEATRVVVLRCDDFTKKYTQTFIDKVKSFDGVPYDINFRLGIEALSCAELAYEGDVERRLDVSLEDVIGVGQLYISPTGLALAKNCTVVIDTDLIKNENNESGEN